MGNKTYDLKQAARELNLEEHIVKQVALEFSGSYQLYLNPIIQAITTHDPWEAVRQAHRLKGAALELRLQHIAHLASQLEVCLGQQNPGPVDALITQLTDYFCKLKQELEDGE